MILIGENINVMSKTIGPALRERNPQPIQELAKAEVEAGVDYLDLNIGPARKAGDELMTWLVNVVQEVTDKPLSLDTTNPVAMEAGLKAHKGRALINSISLARMEEELPLVKKYDADFIGLLWGREGMPRDADERAMIAVELMTVANEMDITCDSIWFDPIVTPVVNVEANQSKPCLEFMSSVGDIAPGCKSAVGLSNVSNGAPAHLRPYLNQTYLMMLMKYGLHSAIVDAFDSELVKVARGEKPELAALVHRVMDGEKPDLSSLSEEEVKYVKTVRVLTGESLYSHSWLEI
ncbi:MAG TPA: dihydropteroate synthase [Dehalococcoidales bacterium]|nr:dihydropteroate synthase [Dehalococcoidales bacterium]